MTKQLDYLVKVLKDEGLEYTLEGNGFSVTLTVEVPHQDIYVLPLELQPFEPDNYQLERMMWKGNTAKKTCHGAAFEVALQGYASRIMTTDPETIALENTLSDRKTISDLDEYQKERDEIWVRVCSDPKIVAWEKELENLL